MTAPTAIVTGAASGIGRGIAELFAQRGMSVVVADINGDGAAEVAERIAHGGAAARAVEVDIADEPSVAAMAEVALSWTGRIDACVANAGTMEQGDILATSPDAWAKVMAVNAGGAYLTARTVLPTMLAQEKGALVFTASTMGLVGMKGVAAYSASKGAVIALTRQLAADYAARGIRVNAIAPGAIRTPLSESQFRARADDDAHFEELLDAVIARYPIPRWGTAKDIAELAHFLVSVCATWMTGQIIPVDGGLLEMR